MPMTSRGTRTSSSSSTSLTSSRELRVPMKWKDSNKDTSPERNKVWTEPVTMPTIHKPSKVPVVYYLSRNGHLEHPHFMEVPLSSTDGLYLRDVIERLNALRGKGMASMYSWSSKRSYKNGFVWHDLSENDFIHPSHGNEYVLKGSELLDPPPPPPPSSFSSLSSSFTTTTSRPLESTSFRYTKPQERETSNKSDVDPDFPVITRRRNQSWSSIDLHEYKVYKTEPHGKSTRTVAADASTQTDDKRRRRRQVTKVKAEEDLIVQEPEGKQYGETDENRAQHSTELTRDEISPPPSDSSPETLETLMKADGRLKLNTNTVITEDGSQQTAANAPSGRLRASSVLMHFISCGSLSLKDCGATYIKDQGVSLIGHYKGRLTRGAGNQNGHSNNNTRNISNNDNVVGSSGEISNLVGIKLEDKEYFSGSLIETKREGPIVPALKRSSSYNADRCSQVQLAEKEVEGARAKCMPRKSRTQLIKKEANDLTSNGALNSQHQQETKRQET